MKAEHINQILDVVAGELATVSPEKGEVKVKNYLHSEKEVVVLFDLNGAVNGLVGIGVDESVLNSLENKEVIFQNISKKLEFGNKLYMFDSNKKPSFQGWTTFVVNLNTTAGDVEVNISLKN
jgi:CheY-specific phosphatase CheX